MKWGLSHSALQPGSEIRFVVTKTKHFEIARLMSLGLLKDSHTEACEPTEKKKKSIHAASAWVRDMQSLRGGIFLHHAKSIVVNKLAVTFCPAGVGGSLFHGSTQF